MRVLVTGASGHLGSALVPELLTAGHEVVGLARSEASATSLKALGAEVRLGDLDDLDGLRDAASSADGVVHLAFKHDVMFAGGYARAIEDDLAVVRAFGEALEGTGKPFVGTSGIAAAAVAGRLGTEDDVRPDAPRVDAENAVAEFSGRGIRSSVVRLPPVVHSTLDRGGFLPTLIGIARGTGVSGYLGDGANRWPAVHTPGRRPRLPAGSGTGTGRCAAARGGRGGRAVPGDRRSHRTAPRRARDRRPGKPGRRSTSASWRGSCPPTPRSPAPGPAKPSAGGPPTPACSAT